jgi:Phosphotransferase enzyme family
VAGLSPQEALPGFATALDEEAMKGYLQEALFGSDPAGYTVERCTPRRPRYIPGEYCILRYHCEARNGASGAVVEPTVMARVFPDQGTCAAYMSEKLAPLVTRMRGRPEVAAFAAPATVIEPLNMVVHVWPIDGELPTLVEATDRGRMIEVFREALPETLEQPFNVQDCQIELVSYRRRARCVLRYTVTGKAAGSDETRNLVVYGKVVGAGKETLASPMIHALLDQVRQRGDGYQFTLPRSLGWRPDLQLALLEASPGAPRQIRRAIKWRLRGRPPPPGAPPLEEMLAICANVAATLHTSGLNVGPVRTIDHDLARLGREIAMVRQFAPEFGDRAGSWLERIAALAGQSEPLELCLNHGDFNHGQLVFDGASGALLDLDTLCQAEPAFDVGWFLGNLRTHTEKLRRSASVSSTLGGELAEWFLRAYVTAAGDRLKDDEHFRARTTLYEAITLLRVALRSHHDFNEFRLDIATTLLEERMSAIATHQLVNREGT